MKKDPCSNVTACNIPIVISDEWVGRRRRRRKRRRRKEGCGIECVLRRGEELEEKGRGSKWGATVTRRGRGRRYKVRDGPSNCNKAK